MKFLSSIRSNISNNDIVIYSFADYEVDTRLYELRRLGQCNSIEPQAFDALVYLIQRRDRFVSKQELSEFLWPDRLVGEAALSRCIMLARKATGDSGAAQRVIQTRYRRGYRFIAGVTEHASLRKLEAT